MEYEDWITAVPPALSGDVLWKVQVYRLALFAVEVGWTDVTSLLRDRRTIGVSDQLYRALGSISANIAEGYSRGTGRDRARFLEYTLGSARESRDWYYKARHILGEDLAQHRMETLTRIIRLLLVMVPQQRSQSVREDTITYVADG